MILESSGALLQKVATRLIKTVHVPEPTAEIVNRRGYATKP
jgi:hypothetical protein